MADGLGWVAPLLGTTLAAGVLLKTTDYLFKQQHKMAKEGHKKKLKTIWG